MRSALIVLLAAFAVGSVAVAQEEAELEPANNNINDVRSLQRGAKYFVNYCLGCHSAKYVRYNRLAKDLLLTEQQLIDNLMFYWLTVTGTSSARLYCESARAGNGALSSWRGRVSVPTGYAVYPYELLQTPRAWAANRYNLVHYSVADRGGHFAAFEQPAIFAADLATFADVLVEQAVF